MSSVNNNGQAGRVYGYARVSTNGQARDGNSLEAQKKALHDAGAEIIFQEKYTGTKANRPQLDKLLSEIEAGDTLIVTKLDRIARSLIQGVELINMLLEKGIKVNILNMGILDNTPSGKLIRSIFFAFAEFERDMIVERTQEGKAIAKKKDGYREGRPKKFTHQQIEHAMELLEEYSYTQVEVMTGISKSTLTRAKRQKRQK
ncbi:MAG: recombinase family protein [Anaerolineaceae bacterium]|nr:recombinase family protein [Anaerolineaceae bacterium]